LPIIFWSKFLDYEKVCFGQGFLTKTLFSLVTQDIVGAYSGGKKDNYCFVADSFIYFIHFIHTSG